MTSKLAGMRRAVRMFALVVVSTSTALAFWPGADAVASTTTKAVVLQTAWYWQNAYEQANPPVAAGPPATEQSGVPTGDLALAYTGNSDKTPSKMTTIAFDLSSVPAGSTITAFDFSVTLDAQPAATSFGAQEASVLACLPTRLWPAGEGVDYTNEPTWDCTDKAAAKVNGSTYSFSIPTIAQSWVTDQNLGVALVNDPAATTAPFQLVFTGAKTIRASMTFTPPAPTTTGGGTGGTTTGSGGTSVVTPTTTGGGGTVTIPPPPTVTQPTGVSPPVVAGTTPATPANASPVAAVKASSALPTTGFWLAGIVLGLIVLVASFVLGDPETPVPVASSSRLERVLRERTTDAFGVHHA